ncbi:MAG: hypothetical protein RL701_8168 [Pseudomonadota bacterium]|jgi:hypothetical protein
MAALPTTLIRTCSLTALLLLSAAAGCGGDDDKPTTPTAGTGGGAAAGASATSGRGGSTAAPAPIACGSKQCSPPANPFAAILGGGATTGISLPGIPQAVACCLDSAAGTCGVGTEGGACEAPAVADPRCPSLDLGPLGSFIGGGALGCCINNACGQDGSLFGRGCVENKEAASMIGAIPLIGQMAQVPGSRACDAPPVTNPPKPTNDNDAGPLQPGDNDAGI